MKALNALIMYGAVSGGYAEAQFPHVESGITPPKSERLHDDRPQGIYEDVRRQLKRAILRLESPEFLVREEAWFEIVKVSTDILPQTHTLPPEIEKLFDLSNVAVKNNTMKAEKAIRLQRAREEIQETENSFSYIIPPGPYHTDEIMRALEQQTEFEIRLDPDMSETMCDMCMNVLPGENDCDIVLKRFCEHMEAAIEFDDDPRVLHIISQEKTRKKMFASGKIIGLVENDPDTPKKSKVELRHAPRFGMLISYHSPFHPFTRPRCTEAITLPSANTMEVDCTVASVPKKIRLVRDEAYKRIGHQEVRMTVDSPEKPCRLTISSVIIGYIDWSETTYNVTRDTYDLVDANTYEIFDIDGKRMNATVTECNTSERNVTITIECEREPCFVDVNAFADLQFERKFRLDLSMNQDEKERSE